MAFRILRVGHLRGRPPGLAGGMSGAKISHSRSERSLGYGQKDGDIGALHKASVLLIERHYLPSRTASRFSRPSSGRGFPPPSRPDLRTRLGRGFRAPAFILGPAAL